jgi:CheY-like chemotaxis protein
LLDNAAKFTPGGGEVWVRAAADPENGNPVILVRDTGIGIDPLLIPYLFEAFSQGEQSLDRGGGGLGLGLALVRGLTELHGGSIRVRSRPEVNGTEFRLEFPVYRALPAESVTVAPAASPSRGASGRRVLIIEDNRDAAATLQDLLELFGHDTRVAYSGLEAMKTAHEYRPDVVLCDIGLPGMNGYEVAAAFRADPATRDVRLVALTGYGGPEFLGRSVAAGFEKHLTKPVDVQELRRVLASEG